MASSENIVYLKHVESECRQFEKLVMTSNYLIRNLVCLLYVLENNFSKWT